MMYRVTMVRLIAGFVLLLTQPITWAQSTSTSDLLAAKLEALQNQKNPHLDGVPVSSIGLLPDLYANWDFQPAWREAEQINALLTVIRNSEADGLTPADFLLPELERRLQQVSFDENEPSPQRVDLDILLTESLIRLAYQFHYGKVDAQDLDANWNYARPLDKSEAVTAIAEIVNADSLADELHALLPQHAAYVNLKKNLTRYREIQSNGGWLSVPSGPTLRRGDESSRIKQLRQRLSVEGFLSAENMDVTLFDAELEAAIKRFQQHHFLAADGAVGPGTLAALNVPIAARIEQIRVNLERGRWVLHDIDKRFVIVDIAGYESFYYDNGEPVWRTRVQVGKPYRKTPVFRDQITYLDINPTWTLPPTIIAKDVLPKVKRDVSYLSQRNIKVLDRNGKVIDPTTLDWSKYSGRNFPYILRQDPGPSNALGRIKFMFPNAHFVYLHDTPSKSLFDRAGRAFSSGCIRVEKPIELAEILLDDPKNWNQAKIRQAIDAEKTRTVRLKKPVPVLLLYWTARIEDDGRIKFKQDIYGRDAAVLKALDGEFRFPTHRVAAKN